MIGYVRNKNVTIGTVNIQNDNFSWIEHGSIPVWLFDINYWINNRVAPINRKNRQAIFKEAGIYNTEDLVDITKLASLNDTIWITFNYRDKWEDVSPYGNTFSRVIAETAFTGYSGISSYSIKSKMSPEYTTHGTYRKKWVRSKNNSIYMIKAGSKKVSNLTGNEPFSEYYSCQVMKHMGYKTGRDYVDYGIRKFDEGIFVNSCKLFTSEYIGFIPIIHFADRDLENIKAFYRSIGQIGLLEKMLLVDAITLNRDRHLNNFGVLIDNKTMKIIGMAPIFDNNLAFCTSIPLRNKNDMNEYYMTMQNSYFQESFNDTVEDFIHKYKEELISLKRFEVDPINDGISNLRNEYINWQIQKRAEELLELV